MSLFQMAPEPKSKLGYYRVLSKTAGVRVSPLCLGAMNIGSAWEGFMGSTNKEASFEILNTYYENGGNFIDTSGNYQNEESEQWIGEWMQAKNNRDQMVIATKFSSPYLVYKSRDTINVNCCGNSKKNLHNSVEASLKKLRTTYIDIMYIHWWDYTTGIEEVMQSLHTFVQSGKILYLGVSDTPAWVVSKANQYARDHGLTPFCVYQGEWSLLTRDFEREILPMCKSEGMALAPWGSLGGGKFKTEEQIKEYESKGEATRKFMRGGIDDKTRAVTKALEKIAKAKGVAVTGIAMAYVMHKAPFVFPIVGARKASQLKENIEALEKVTLSPEEIKELEDSSPLDLGFPHAMLGGTNGRNMFFINYTSKFSWVPEEQPIRFEQPTQKQ